MGGRWRLDGPLLAQDLSRAEEDCAWAGGEASEDVQRRGHMNQVPPEVRNATNRALQSI